MANPEHLEILEQVVEAWNEWRRSRSEITPDLKGADLRGAKLARPNFHLSGELIVNVKGSTRLTNRARSRRRNTVV